MTSPKMLEIEEGRHLRTLVEGPEGAPFILFDAGAFGIYADGWWVKEALKLKYRVCLYDRAGMGQSDAMPNHVEPTPLFHVEDMRKLRAALGEEEPFILIGHSMAGLRLHTYANAYPEELRGLIFVDALSPRLFDRLGGKQAFDGFEWLLNAGLASASFGLTQPFLQFAPNLFQLSGFEREQKAGSYANEGHFRASRNEVRAVDVGADYLRGEGISQKPLAILSSTIINHMSEEDVKRAQENTGYGWYQSFPKENHISVLVGEFADLIAKRVNEIIEHTQENQS